MVGCAGDEVVDVGGLVLLLLLLVLLLLVLVVLLLVVLLLVVLGVLVFILLMWCLRGGEGEREAGSPKCTADTTNEEASISVSSTSPLGPAMGEIVEADAELFEDANLPLLVVGRIPVRVGKISRVLGRWGRCVAKYPVSPLPLLLPLLAQLP